MAADFDPLTQQLYAVTLLAVFTEKRGNKDDRVPDIPAPVQVQPWAIVATSPEEAVRLGIDRARELWPESRGWFGHRARVVKIHLELEHPKVNSLTAEEERIM